MWTERSVEGREERVRGLGEVLTGGPRGVREREAETGDVRRCGGVADRQARAVDGRTRCAAELG